MTASGKGHSNLSVGLTIRNHHILSDVSEKQGGADLGPDPHELVKAALVACTIMTVKMYAARKQYALEDVVVTVGIESETREKTVFTRDISFVGDLTQEQRDGLFVIANKCPIHRLLTGAVEINSTLNS
jgi:putative redox protein